MSCIILPHIYFKRIYDFIKQYTTYITYNKISHNIKYHLFENLYYGTKYHIVLQTIEVCAKCVGSYIQKCKFIILCKFTGIQNRTEKGYIKYYTKANIFFSIMLCIRLYLYVLKTLFWGNVLYVIYLSSLTQFFCKGIFPFT